MIKENNLVPVPSANIAVNKSRVKLYKNTGDMPTYYLQKGQEFQIELFNPTQDVIMAKIYLNDKAISQGGLIIRQGERIFLERYIDVAKKFLFDTYEVSNSEEVKKAIKNNGDFKVEFFRETTLMTLSLHDFGNTYVSPSDNSGNYNSFNNTTTSRFISGSMYDANLTTPIGSNTEKSLNVNLNNKIETGKVEQGSTSEQKIKSVVMDFEFSPFHTIECKMLPVSQKINTVDDIKVKVYCTFCGSKLGKGDKFCSSCGTKA